MKNKLRAFTISELLVSMIISSILMYAIWNIYFFLVSYQKQISTKADAEFQTANLRFLLTKDFEEADIIAGSGNSLEFINDVDSVFYEAVGENLVRVKGNSIDTLPVPVAFQFDDEKGMKLTCCIDLTQTCFILEKPAIAKLASTQD